MVDGLGFLDFRLWLGHLCDDAQALHFFQLGLGGGLAQFWLDLLHVLRLRGRGLDRGGLLLGLLLGLLCAQGRICLLRCLRLLLFLEQTELFLEIDDGVLAAEGLCGLLFKPPLLYFLLQALVFHFFHDFVFGGAFHDLLVVLHGLIHGCERFIEGRVLLVQGYGFQLVEHQVGGTLCLVRSLLLVSLGLWFHVDFADPDLLLRCILHRARVVHLILLQRRSVLCLIHSVFLVLDPLDLVAARLFPLLLAVLQARLLLLLLRVVVAQLAGRVLLGYLLHVNLLHVFFPALGFSNRLLHQEIHLLLSQTRCQHFVLEADLVIVFHVLQVTGLLLLLLLVCLLLVVRANRLNLLVLLVSLVLLALVVLVMNGGGYLHLLLIGLVLRDLVSAIPGFIFVHLLLDALLVLLVLLVNRMVDLVPRLRLMALLWRVVVLLVPRLAKLLRLVEARAVFLGGRVLLELLVITEGGCLDELFIHCLKRGLIGPFACGIIALLWDLEGLIVLLNLIGFCHLIFHQVLLAFVAVLQRPRNIIFAALKIFDGLLRVMVL